MANLRRIFIVVTGSVAVAGGAAYSYFGTPSHRTLEQFALISDLPSDDHSSNGSPRNRKVPHDRIDVAIQQRLLAAYRSLAYAESGKWSLATWAQLQWVRNTLDGAGLEEIQAGTRIDPSLQDFSFVRLLNELVKTASPDQEQAALDARRDGTAIVEELTAMTPNTKEPTQTLKHVVFEIESSPGLHPFVKDFPRFRDISLPPDNH